MSENTPRLQGWSRRRIAALVFWLFVSALFWPMIWASPADVVWTTPILGGAASVLGGMGTGLIVPWHQRYEDALAVTSVESVALAFVFICYFAFGGIWFIVIAAPLAAFLLALPGYCLGVLAAKTGGHLGRWAIRRQ